MTGVPHWEDPASGYGAEFDRVTLGGLPLPGVWKCDFEVSRDLDVKKAPGHDGATFKDNGYYPTPITLSGSFTSQADWFQYQEVVSLLHPRMFKSTARNKERSALVLEHPNAAIFGIRAVYLIAIVAPTWDERGVCYVGMRVMQAIKAPKKAPKQKTNDAAEDVYTISINELPPRALDRYPGMVGVNIQNQDDVSRPSVLLPQIAP